MQGQTTLTNTATSITWVLDEGSAAQSADYMTGTEAYFESESVSTGSNLIYTTLANNGGGPLGTRTVNGGTFTCWETNGKIDTAGPESAVDFAFEATEGLTFTPTLITLDAQRFGTGNGLLDVEWVNADGTTSVATAQATARDNTGAFSSLSFDVSGLGITPGAGVSTLKLYLYSLQEAKQFGLANVKIDGVLNGTILDGSALTDNASEITWPLGEGSAAQTENYLTGTELYFKPASVSAGSNLIFTTLANNGGGPIGTRTVNGGTFTCWETNGKINTAGPESAVDFTIQPVDGLTFTPTTISLDAQRFGTGNGKIDIEWVNENGTTTVVTAQATARDNEGVFTSLSFDLSSLGITPGAGKSTLKIYLYSLQENKQFGLANVKIQGLLNGAVEADTDVWDFGAEQLDAVLFNNVLNEDKINAWYDASVTPGTSGNGFPGSWTEGALTWTGSDNDRLRTSNTNLTRYDDNVGTTEYTGRVYSNSRSDSRFFTITLADDDEVTFTVTSQDGKADNMQFQYVADPAQQNDIISVAAGEVVEAKFVAKSAGDYKFFSSNDKMSVYRVVRKGANYVTLAGNVDENNAPGLPNGYSIDFTNEAGKTYSAVVSNGTYSIDLPADLTYNISVGGANGYLIGNGFSIDVTEDTTNYDIEVIQVTLFSVTGSISGLPDLTDLEVTFTADPSANTVYKPVVVLDKVNETYSVRLEADVEYTIAANGVNDYEIATNKLTITGDQNADIVFSEKTKYNVAINTSDLDTTKLANLSLTFTNLNEDGYAYTFTGVSSIALRDGVYSVTYESGLDEFPVEMALTSNITIAGADITKDLTFNPVNEWVFNDRKISGATAYKGLIFTGNVNVRGGNGDLNAGSGATISIPVSVGDKVIITDYYASDYSVEGGAQVTNTSNSTSTNIVTEYIYTGTTDGTVTIAVAGTSYFVSIKTVPVAAYRSTITVGTDKDYKTINEALNEISYMDRPNDEPVTVLIDPGNYEEMLVIENPNITLKNAASIPSIGLLNKGVDIETGAVRITSYYGQKYNFFSQGVNNKWNAEALAVNKENGYTDYINREGTGSGSSYWNATVVVKSTGFTAEDIILENSFNQYISKKESEDVVLAKNPSAEPTRPTDYGNIDVQDRSKGYVTQAAAIGIAGSADKVILNNCRVIGRQDSFYGAAPARVVVYKGAMMGAVDYIFGGMNAVFYKTDFVFNTSDFSSDAAYITAAQQFNTNQRGFLMYECHIKSPIAGVETASEFGAKPGYFGRPWSANTSEVVFYNTTVDKSTYPGSEGKSLINPLGWTSSLGGESPFMYEFGTIEESGVDNSAERAAWSTILTSPTLTDGTEITTFNFTKGNDDWDPIPNLDANEDTDFDGILDVNDNCPTAYNPNQEDFNNDGIGDVCQDSDGDGLLDSDDKCPSTTPGVVIDVFGCELLELPTDNFTIEAVAVSCNGAGDGSITIDSKNTILTFNATVSGNGTNITNSFSGNTTFDGLAAGTYEICITIDGKDNFIQCYNINVQGPTPLSAYAKVDRTKKIAKISLDGATSYTINHNGTIINTTDATFELQLVTGNNSIKITTDYDCQGKYSEDIFISEDVLAYPNPTKSNVKVFVNGEDSSVNYTVFDLKGRQLQSSSNKLSSNRIVNIDLTRLSNGVYYIELKGKTVNKSIKIVKTK